MIMTTAMTRALRCALLLIVGLGAGAPALAQVQIPNVFEAGQTARAADVNENFDVLADALASALSVLDVLESRVNQLEDELAQAQQPSSTVAALEARISDVEGALAQAQQALLGLPVLGARVDDVEAEITTTQSALAATQDVLAATEASVPPLADRVSVVETELQALAGSGPGEQLEILASRLDLLEDDLVDVLAMSAYLSTESANALTGQPTIRFSGVNLQIDNGFGPSGAAASNGTGNLILGFNTEAPSGFDFLPARCPNGSADATSCPGQFQVNHRSGSHNLIIGEGHSYSGLGAVVSGFRNRSLNDFSVAMGGQDNLATGRGAVVLTGQRNWVTNEYTFSATGDSNRISGRYSAVFAGQVNDVRSQFAALLGGVANFTQDPPGGTTAVNDAVMVGGQFNRIEVEAVGPVIVGCLSASYPTSGNFGLVSPSTGC